MTFKKITNGIHLWLGFTCGLIVFIVAVTGCIYAFQVEIQNATQPYRFVQQQDRAVMPPSALKAIADKELPGRHTHAVLYAGAGKAAEVIYFAFDPEYYYVVYLNPYTGEVLKVKDMEADFFHIILDGHFYLWLPPTIGQPVTATATLIFLVMLVTGIIMWWPRNRSGVKQRFTIKWRARWRRRNYDLHNVLGFYSAWVAIILAVTGLVWGFQWFAQGMYTVTGGEKSLVYAEPASDNTATYSGEKPGIDKVWDIMRKQYPTAAVIEVHVPENAAASIAANANPDGDTYWQADYSYFDQNTLKELEVSHIYGKMANTNAADKLLRMNYDIHVGGIFGLSGKILAFCASLIVATLPITGVYIWWGRRKKKDTPPPKSTGARKAVKKPKAITPVEV